MYKAGQQLNFIIKLYLKYAAHKAISVNWVHIIGYFTVNEKKTKNILLR